NSSRPFLGLIGGEFNPMMADADVAKLEEYYRNFGFHDVRVARELQWNPDLRNVRLVFHIHEGSRYRLGGIDVNGSAIMDREELLHLTTQKPGEYYNDPKAQADLERMKAAYGYRGYEPVIQKAVYYPPDRPGELLVHYDFVERPQARVGEIIIVGNTVTKQ